MLTRSLYLAAGWFAISLIATLIGGYRLRKSHLALSIGWLTIVLFLGDLWALLTFGAPIEILGASILAFVFGIGWILLLPNWNAFGQVTWAMTILATLLFVIYSFMVTAFTPLNILSFLIALDFFMLEALALMMALTHAYESLDLFCRIRWLRRVVRMPYAPGYVPMVSLHVPAYNEPPEVVRETLKSLARLDYTNYEVLVIDNNTPNTENWDKIHDLCLELGPKFRFVHLDKWPGYKSGALNFALAHTAPEAEIIGSIDADYIVQRNFLRELVPAFANPKLGFVQAPQDYRYNKHDPFSESTYHGYQYFFEVSMPVRNEHNAIIFCGTMGLIRKSALQEIGGWDEWCITEDAEASLRILKLGYESLYINKSYGRGLMPYTFEGLKKQRFRWCFGGIQILKKHWSALMPWAHRLDPQNHLTGAQRYYYLVGGLQWYTDPLNLIFGLFLTLGAIASIFYGFFSVRPLTGPLLILPAVFLILHLWRFLWVLRKSLRLPAFTALRSMYNFFSLGWAVTLACIQGLIFKKGVFLRTPKSKGESKVWSALRVTQWETSIGLIFLAGGLAAFLVRPVFTTFWLGLLLAWQASLFLAAPYFSILSVLDRPGPNQRHQDLDRGQPVPENFAARWVWGTFAVLLIVALIAFQIPLPTQLPGYAILQPPTVPPQVLIGINPTPFPTQTDVPTVATQTPTGTLPPTLTIVPSSTVTSTLVPSATPLSPSPSATIVEASPTPTASLAAPTATGTATAALCTPTVSVPPPIGVSPTPTLLAIPSPTC